MKRSRGERRPGVAIGSEPTGRHGAIDFALQMAGAGETAGGDHIYRVIEIVGTSKKSISDAIDRAIARAHKTLRNLRWFEVMRRPHRQRQGTALSGDAVGGVHDGGAGVGPAGRRVGGLTTPSI